MTVGAGSDRPARGVLPSEESAGRGQRGPRHSCVAVSQLDPARCGRATRFSGGARECARVGLDLCTAYVQYGTCAVPAVRLCGRYLLDSRDVQIEWQYATEPGGQARDDQPFSEQNVSRDMSGIPGGG